MVDRSGVEPLTPTLPAWCSTNWANGPKNIETCTRDYILKVPCNTYAILTTEHSCHLFVILRKSSDRRIHKIMASSLRSEWQYSCHSEGACIPPSFRRPQRGGISFPILHEKPNRKRIYRKKLAKERRASKSNSVIKLLALHLSANNARSSLDKSKA